MKRLASEAQLGASADNRKRRTANACDARAAAVPQPALVPVGAAHDGAVTGDSLQAELRANFNDFLVLGAPDTTAKAACRTLLTTGILIDTKLVASKLTELDRWCGDAASRILAELILTHDRECRARTDLAVVASRVKRRDAPLSENAPALVAAEEPSDAPSGVLVEWVSDQMATESKPVVSQTKLLQSKSSYSMLVKTQGGFCIIRGQHINLLQHHELTTGE